MNRVGEAEVTFKRPKLSIVLPCYNESQVLPSLVLKLVRQAASLGWNESDLQIVVVDNGSTDETSVILERLLHDAELGRWLEAVRIPVNQGYGHGVFRGLSAAAGEYVGWTHADGQCSMEDVFRGFARLGGRRRVLLKGSRLGRSAGAWMFSRLSEMVSALICGRWFYEVNAQPKLFHRDLFNRLENAPKGVSFDLFVLLRARDLGFYIDSFPVQVATRAFGHSRWARGIVSRARTIWAVVQFCLGYRLRRLMHSRA